MRLRSQTGRAATGVPDDARPVPAPDRAEARLPDVSGLGDDELRRIEEYRARTGAGFADAAVDLGLLTPEAVARAQAEHATGGLAVAEGGPVDRAVVAAFDPFDPLALKLRALRSTLFRPEDLRGPGARVLLLTGAGTDDTAVVAANLAVLVAQLGQPGLLVDANFPAPAQAGLFGVDGNGGATALVAGGDPRDAGVVATAVPNLDLLPAGAEIPALSEAVERVQLVAQLRALRNGYRFIILDAGEQAPELIAALARGVDGVLIVAERRRTSMGSMRTLLGRLEADKVPVLGTVLAR